MAGVVRSQQTPQPNDPNLTLALDGVWKAIRWPFAHDERTFCAPVLDDALWERVTQPGKVFYADPEAERKPTPNWNRVTLTHIDPDDGAILRKTVTVPATWSNKRIMLRFDSVYPAARFYLNGHYLGEHLSGLTPVEFDVTDHLEPGSTAVVAVRLIRRHRFVQMDMVRHAMEFAGLAQSACFFAVEPCHVSDRRFTHQVAADLASASVDAAVSVHNTSSSDTDLRFNVAYHDDTGRLAAEASLTERIAANSRRDLSINLILRYPQLWSDEAPRLYTVFLRVETNCGAPVEYSFRTGFRRFDLSPDGAKLNGSFVKFRGVNHLTFHPDHGMYTPEDWLRRNLTLMKRANVNAIRTHFLGPRCLAGLCDEMGMFLMQELPIDWGADYIHDPDWVEPALLRIEGGIRRDRHHPSVMVWCIGNENMPKTKAVAEAGWSHLRSYDEFAKRLDPSRPTMFPPPGPANAIEGILELRVGDIADTHYCFDYIRRFLAEGQVENPNSWEADKVLHTRQWALDRGWSGVWFSSEYGIFNAMPDLLHSPSASIISDVPEDLRSMKSTFLAFEERLEREWGFMRSEPSCLGGAYFPWLCAGAGSAEGGNPWGWVRWGEDADWGVVTADLMPKPFFWAMRVLFSPVWFPKRVAWSSGQTAIEFTVQNQYNSINLRDCTLRVQQAQGGAYMTMMRRFTDVPVEGAPGQDCLVRIPLEDGVLDALAKGRFAVCRCTVIDHKGFRPIVAEILVEPSFVDGRSDGTMTIGPDAALK